MGHHVLSHNRNPKRLGYLPVLVLEEVRDIICLCLIHTLKPEDLGDKRDPHASSVVEVCRKETIAFPYIQVTCFVKATRGHCGLTLRTPVCADKVSLVKRMITGGVSVPVLKVLGF